MDELAKALAEAVKTGSQLAWPALVMYFVANALGNIAFGGTFVGVAWLITRAVMHYPEAEAKASMQRYNAELERDMERSRMRQSEWKAEAEIIKLRGRS